VNQGTLLGFDVGSSSIKASLVDSHSGRHIGSAVSPREELPILAEKAGWAEQHPHTWWEHVVNAASELAQNFPTEMEAVSAVGISYQMHGLVLVDRKGKILRPAIIWCDSRAVPYGEQAFKEIGRERCFAHLLNSPGNFTAAKLAWVKDREPDIYSRIWKIMLPGDYIAYRMTGEIHSTFSGLSEGTFWDFPENRLASFLLDHFGFDADLLPPSGPSFSIQGVVSKSAAEDLHIAKGVPVSYRAGDQPNNALSLKVMEPGDVASTAGTSGVVYGLVEKPVYDDQSRVNTFIHVNHGEGRNRFGVLLCINGTGILNRWIRNHLISKGGVRLEYEEMNSLAESVAPGAEGLTILPFGNGAERALANADPGASIHNLNFNIHSLEHIVRAGQEGIIFAFQYGLKIMKNMGIKVQTVRAGYANMFLSPLFRKAFATVTGARVELYATDGAQGAARGAGIGAGIFPDTADAFRGLEKRDEVEPSGADRQIYIDLYEKWCEILNNKLQENA
jgi:xylulokinase